MSKIAMCVECIHQGVCSKRNKYEEYSKEFAALNEKFDVAPVTTPECMDFIDENEITKAFLHMETCENTEDDCCSLADALNAALESDCDCYRGADLDDLEDILSAIANTNRDDDADEEEDEELDDLMEELIDMIDEFIEEDEDEEEFSDIPEEVRRAIRTLAVLEVLDAI